MRNESAFGVTEYARSLIRFRAKQLARRSGFSRSDRDDLEQRLWLALRKQADGFDADRASVDTFADRVVNSAVAMILRERRRLKRVAGLRAQSLDRVVPAEDEGDESCALRDLLSDDDRGRRLGTVSADPTTQRLDHEAFEHGLDSLPEHLRDVCRRVMGGSVLSASRELGISRRQVRNSLAEARPYFERAGFGDPESDGHPASARHT